MSAHGQSYEAQAREMLDRMGVEDAANWSSGEVIELANLLAEVHRLRAAVSGEGTKTPNNCGHIYGTETPCPQCPSSAPQEDKVKIDLLPFTTPNYVLQRMPPRPRQDGLTFAPKYPLCDVPADDLAALCDQFRAEIFRKAGKSDPAASQEDSQ